MKWILVAVVAVGMFAQAETPDQELIRLRKENAALKAEIAELKKELAAAKPAAPKATVYTAAALVKLIPNEQLPANAKWDGPRVGKIHKILDANLVGEWVQIDVKVVDIAEGEERRRFNAAAGAAGGVDVIVDGRFPQSLPLTVDARKSVSVIGKVKTVYVAGEVNSGTAPRIVVVLEESRLGK